MARPLVLGTAGHIDHGKTALVEALTGTNTDRLAEEQQRGMSIELGFAELVLPSGRRLGVVDVPGHERLVRTMVAGASGIDLFLMVIAVDDGVMPETREHLAVLRALGIQRGVVALSKCDLAPSGARQNVASDVRQLIPGTPLAEVSVKTGIGLKELVGALDDAAAQTDTEANDDGWAEVAVLHVDRVFTLPGIGTVVTGTLSGGELKREDRVNIWPTGIEARIRSMQTHDRAVDRAHASQRVALNLAGIKRSQISRGDVVAAATANLRPTYRLDVELILPPAVGTLTGERVQIHHGTRQAPARVVVLDDCALAQLRLESPLVARPGDRFVIRCIAPPVTLGGGVVLDPKPARHGPGPATEQLRLISAGDPEELIARALAARAEGIPPDPADWTTDPLLGPALGRYSSQQWQAALRIIVESGAALERDARIVSSEDVSDVRDEAVASGDAVSVDLTATAHQALGLLAADGWQPRAPQDLADALGVDRGEALALLERLVIADKAVRVKPGLYYAKAELAGACQATIGRTRERGSLTVAELRDALGISRKYSQALLEHLDASKVTVRQGDRHVLRRHPPLAED